MADNGERRRASATATRRAPRERKVRSAADAARCAADELAALVHHPQEGVSAVRRSEEGGWSVVLDVLELARIPDTTSLLATYEVELDAEGRMVQYCRTARYRRGGADQ
ncbi:gas vesicle protein GvpO [Streptomyces sp. NPDC056600]|uniref:gas vesicle protein GvpO n=1 Tax=Streptomyces sp. NPDC056600 TaxID=3345874 RepID=UPI00368CF935